MRSVGHPVRDDVDLLDGRLYAAGSHDIWEWMRREAPVYYDANSDVWAITRHEDVLRVEKDPVTFSSTGAPRPHLAAFPMMISMDDPEHRRRRGLISRGFTPRRVAEMEPRIAALCEGILDDLAGDGRCDFVWDVAAPLPLMVIADLLGFDQAVRQDLLRWSDDMLRVTTSDPTPEQVVVAADAMSGFRELQLSVIADRRRDPGDDLISILCHAEIDGERLDDESIVSEALLLLIGGDETTRHVISGGLLALLEHPEQLELLRSDPAVLGSAVEEMLRWVTPVKNMSRLVTTDVVVRGQPIPAGDQVINLYPSANRDEEVFADPQRFDVARDPNPHLAFGFGPHFCLGAALARLEIRCMFRELLARWDDVELAGASEVRPSNFVSGLEAMPVAFRTR